MANHGYCNLNVDVTFQAVVDKIKEMNEEKFGGMLYVTVDEDYLCVECDDYRIFECWMDGKRTIEFRHGNSGVTEWWFDGYISSLLTAHFGGTITDDGHDSVEEPDFHIKYPNVIEYMKLYSKHGKFPWMRMRMYIKLEKDMFSKPVWEHIKRMK